MLTHEKNGKHFSNPYKNYFKMNYGLKYKMQNSYIKFRLRLEENILRYRTRQRVH